MTKLAARAVMGVFLATTACSYPRSGAAPGPLSPASAATAASRWPGATAESLDAGRTLFLDRCNGCHGYPDLNPISANRWPGIMTDMGHKSHLTPEQTQQVLHFILAAREQP